MQKETATPAWYWHLWPHKLEFLYVCADRELHLMRATLWLGRSWGRHDKMLCPLSQLVGSLYGFDAALAMAQPEPKETTH